MEISNSEIKSYKKYYVEQHMISALLYFLSLNEINGLRGTINASNLEVVYARKVRHIILE